MKKTYLTLITIAFAINFTYAQTNIFPPNGNAGIGTTSPTQNIFGFNKYMDITGASAPGLLFHSNGGTQEAAIGSGGDGLIMGAAGAATAAGNNVIRFFTGNTNSSYSATERMRIDAAGNVGIGTTTPHTPLEVNGDITLYSTNGSRVLFGYGSGPTYTGQIGSTFGITGSGAKDDFNAFIFGNNPFNIWTNSTKRITVDGSGNVGIGTTSPVYKLDVQGGNASIYNNGTASGLVIGSGATGKTYVALSNSADASGYGIIQTVAASGSAYGNTIINPSGGNVGIGTTIPDEKLSVLGNIHANEVKVDLSVPGPDYVFNTDYKLPKLSELKAYVDKNHHLPEIPSAEQMAKDGISLGDMNTKLLKKVEELTLYLIKQQKQIDLLNKQVSHSKKPKQ